MPCLCRLSCALVLSSASRVSGIALKDPFVATDGQVQMLPGFVPSRDDPYLETWSTRPPMSAWTLDLINKSAERIRREGGAPLSSRTVASGHFPQRVYYHHIPKVGGHSVKMDVSTLFPSPFAFPNSEGCFNDHKVYFGVQGAITFLREPRGHVLSQYSHLMGGGPATSLLPDFGQWVHDWADFWRLTKAQNRSLAFLKDKNFTEQERYVGFNPIEKQTHKMTCTTPYYYPEHIDVDRAVQIMHSASFVGILEFYPESLCVLHALVTGVMPTSCDCEKRGAVPDFWHHNSCCGPPHDIHTVTEDTIKLIDEITKADRHLYNEAVDNFLSTLRQIEDEQGVQILCVPH